MRVQWRKGEGPRLQATPAAHRCSWRVLHTPLCAPPHPYEYPLLHGEISSQVADEARF